MRLSSVEEVDAMERLESADRAERLALLLEPVVEAVGAPGPTRRGTRMAGSSGASMRE